MRPRSIADGPAARQRPPRGPQSRRTAAVAKISDRRRSRRWRRQRPPNGERRAHALRTPVSRPPVPVSKTGVSAGLSYGRSYHADEGTPTPAAEANLQRGGPRVAPSTQRWLGVAKCASGGLRAPGRRPPAEGSPPRAPSPAEPRGSTRRPLRDRQEPDGGGRGGWDFTTSDMSRYRLKPAQQLQRQVLRISRNHDEAAAEVAEKIRSMQENIAPFVHELHERGWAADAAPPSRMTPCFASRVPTGRLPGGAAGGLLDAHGGALSPGWPAEAPREPRGAGASGAPRGGSAEPELGVALARPGPAACSAEGAPRYKFLRRARCDRQAFAEPSRLYQPAPAPHAALGSAPGAEAAEEHPCWRAPDLELSRIEDEARHRPTEPYPRLRQEMSNAVGWQLCIACCCVS
ncbi:unnamed protein product, partial [Prorocentrum cordatum]